MVASVTGWWVTRWQCWSYCTWPFLLTSNLSKCPKPGVNLPNATSTVLLEHSHPLPLLKGWTEYNTQKWLFSRSFWALLQKGEKGQSPDTKGFKKPKEELQNYDYSHRRLEPSK